MKRLYRSRRSRILGGVAAGFAEYFDLDATLIRLGFALLGVTVPSSILAYILAWLIIPEDPVWTSVPPVDAGIGAEPPRSEPLEPVNSSIPVLPIAAPAPLSHGDPDRSRQLFGYILIAVGAIVLVRKFIPDFVWRLPFRLLGQAWPVLLIVLGAVLILGAVRGRQ